VFLELERLGAIAQAAVVAEQLPSLARAAGRHADLPFLLDHCAFSDFGGGDGFPNAGSLFDLATVHNVSVKLSNYVWQLASAAGAEPRAVTRAVVDAFGAARVMWASDLTVHDRPYAELIADAEAACVELSDAERSRVFGQAAAAMWWPS
jgi:L-fuconolactonase